MATTKTFFDELKTSRIHGLFNFQRKTPNNNYDDKDSKATSKKVSTLDVLIGVGGVVLFLSLMTALFFGGSYFYHHIKKVENKKRIESNKNLANIVFEENFI